MTKVAGIVSVQAMIAAGTMATSLLLTGGAARALDEAASEKDVLKACEKQLCEIVAKKDAKGSDLACNLSKTWSKTKIVEGIATKKLSWGFGDARCTIDVKAARAAIIGAVSGASPNFEFDPHTVKCQIEREKEVTEIAVTLAPKIEFKDGKAVKVWLGLKNVEAPSVVKGVIWTAAQVENNFGLFHSEMVAEINELIGQKCPKVVAGQ